MRHLDRLDNISGSLRVIYSEVPLDDDEELKAMVDVAECYLNNKLDVLTEMAREHDPAHGVDYSWLKQLIEELREPL